MPSNRREPLLIFDLDGLLVDTEKLFYQAYKIVARRYGQSPAFAKYVEQVMSFGHDVAGLIEADPNEAPAIREQVSEEYSKQLKRGIALRHGARECLNRLDNYQSVLVTGSRREHADLILDRCKLRGYFDKIITRDDGFPPKPSPMTFQHVLDKYKRNSKDCLVIEDSRRGVTAALHLGIPCVFVPNEYTRKEVFNDDVTRLNSLDELTREKVLEVLSNASLKLDQRLVNLYWDGISRLSVIFERYKTIYGLPEYVHEDTGIAPAAFAYAKKRSFFVILVITTKDGRTYFQRSFDTGHLSMILPGSGVRLKENDTMLGVIKRLARRALRDARLADIAPLIFLRNRFECEDGGVVEHIGLGVRALLLNDVAEIAKYDEDVAVKGSFISDFPIDEIPQQPAAEVYRHFKQWQEGKDYTTYVNEIEAQEGSLWRYRVHQATVNCVLRAASRAIGKHSIADVKGAILEKVGRCASCLDVACGDDKSIFDILLKVPFVVANDISVSQIEQMEREYHSRREAFPKLHTMMFTNHDCMDLPFRDGAFDVAICRNLLHHMTKAQDLKLLLDNMSRVARRLLIVEVRDPKHEGL